MNRVWHRIGMRASTSVRLFALFALLLAGALAMAGAITWIATARTAEQQVRQRIELEVQALERELAEEGFRDMIEAIEVRVNQPGALAYRIERPDGSLPIDDIHRRPSGPGWTRVRVPGATARARETLVYSSRLQDGSLLSIGEDLERAQLVRAALLSALAWSGAVALLLGLGGAAILTRRSLARMERVSGAVERFVAGDHAVRAPHRQVVRGDDVDVIAAGVNTMLDRIAALSANLRLVSTAVAHELRTPVTHVRQRLEMLADSASLPADCAAVVQGAQAGIDEILHTFESMLSLAEIEVARADGRFGRVDLRTVCENIAEAYSADIETGGRALGVALDSSAWVRGDAHLLGRVVANLLENAMRHTPQGTRIRISLTRAAGSVTLRVADDGPGIAIEERERVLEPFHRVDRSHSLAGCGLGLAIVVAIAQAHGAALQLDDAQPGLCVSLVFALDQSEVADSRC